MNVFLDALSDAWSQMTGTLAYVAQAFGENWRTGLAALLARPAALFYVVGVVAVLALVLRGLTAENRVGYRRGRFLSANEKIFLRTLDAALGRNYRAFAQVRLAELANPADSANVHLRRRALNAVMAKSVDFVICDVLTLDPVAVIEVDDRSHLLPERRDRDAFVNAVFAEIGLPLLRVKAQRTYSVAEFRDLFARVDLSRPTSNLKEHLHETLHPRRPSRWRDRGLCAAAGLRTHAVRGAWIRLGDRARDRAQHFWPSPLVTAIAGRLERGKRTGERTSSSGSGTAKVRPEEFVASVSTGGVDVLLPFKIATANVSSGQVSGPSL